MTPAEMADWLDSHILRINNDDEPQLAEILKWIKAQPTDAQKIEALKEMAEAAEWGVDGARELTDHNGIDETLDERTRYHIKLGSSKMAEIAWHHARAAMRLLGLNPEGVAKP